MKVAAFNGSPNKEGNSYHALELVAKQLVTEGIEVEIIHVGNKQIRSCLACGRCSKMQDETCAITTDRVNEWNQKMKEADGVLLGSPVHYSGVAGSIKIFLDRAFYVATVNGAMMRHKVGVSVVAVRRSGVLTTFNELNHFINYSEMLMPTSDYWNVIHGRTPVQDYEDAEGM